MKKISALIIIVLIFSGCSFQNMVTRTENALKNITFVLREKSLPKSVSLSPEQATKAQYANINEKILNLYLKNNIQMENLSTNPEMIVPDFIYSNQLYKYYKLGDIFFALFMRSNMNFPLEKSTKYSGVLVGELGKPDWDLFFEIKNVDLARNNPLHMWSEGENLFIMVVDSFGAGSGEGIAKVIGSNDGGKSWSVIKCFYYEPESFEKLAMDKSNIGNVIIEYLNLEMTGEINREYIYNAESKLFESKTNFQALGKTQIYVQENCANILLTMPEYEAY